ncbi:radical SAM protein [Bacillus sp. FJAT-29814]|uniref:B12-binding domain-containing radical SAM protein n=1 Tax=Bacillus sp. FJAT-29814 TaxID=1729688 RepID=UPI00082E3492|nr:radical SAM protein [Bacillus sp. FJAT-29814]
MDVVLINAPVTRVSPHSKLALPLGLAYIAAVLLEEGRTVKAVDFNVSGLNLRRVDHIVQQKPSVVGISALTETYPNALKIAKRIKELDDHINIVFGGAHASILPDEVLQEQAIDYVVMSEGEAAMAELCQYLLDGKGQLKDIKGVGYKDEAGRVRLNPRRELLDPNSLPYPARDLFPMEFYQEQSNISTARGGCPFQCPFCSGSYIWEGRRRPRTPENIMEELKMLYEQRGAEYTFFSEDLFTVNKKWVRKLLELINQLDYPIKWGCATRVDCVDEQLIADMAAAGCVSIQFGVESGSQRILDSVKGITKEQVGKVIRACKKYNIHVASSFMVPFPQDTRETLMETKEFIKQLYDEGSQIYMSFTSPFPGTEFYQKREELGIKILTDQWDEFDAKHNIIETRNLSAKEIEELVNEIAEYTGLVKRV